jgi:hypothetical protein
MVVLSSAWITHWAKLENDVFAECITIRHSAKLEKSVAYGRFAKFLGCDTRKS